MSHYFDEAPSLPSERATISLTIRGKERDFETAPGVFARDGLDKATAILLDYCDPPPAGTTVLDLGCGWGPIAVTLSVAGAEVHAIDINERARELTRANASRHDVAVTVLAPTDVPVEKTFDQIWSNPPIRIGKEALHELLLTWLPRLNPGGLAYLVVGKNLGADSLQRWLTEQGWPTERLHSAKGFRILRVQREPATLERA